MKASEAMQKLQKIIAKYGDCELTKIDNTGLTVNAITDFEFIGANRIIIVTDAPDEKLLRAIYERHEQEKNKLRKKEWLEDCE